ncbi:hypothetical protein BY996DRAFT_6534609 [Phakopsora pachyrhizi]|nr:hypothetical protein BY996DRAFT_6534609 [Phakopsora pachyrhizi]
MSRITSVVGSPLPTIMPSINAGSTTDKRKISPTFYETVTQGSSIKPRTKHEELMRYIPQPLQRLIVKIDNPPKDGDCGYTCVAWSSGKGRGILTPELIRKHLSAELKEYKKMYEMIEGRNIDEDIRNTQAGKSAGVAGWLKMPLFGYAITYHLRRSLYYFSLDSMHKYLPTSSSYSGYTPFCMAFVDTNHYVLPHFKKVNGSIPSPPIDGWWLRKYSSRNKNLWLQSLENDLKLFQKLMPSSNLLPGLSDFRRRNDRDQSRLDRLDRKSLEERHLLGEYQNTPLKSSSETGIRYRDKLVKVHVKSHQDFKLALAQNKMEEAKINIKKAMDSQKTLHKLKEKFPTNPKNKNKMMKGSLQKLPNLNSSFLNEILNKIELLNENMITSNKNINSALQQIYKACSQSDPDAKNSSNLEATLEKFSAHVEKIDIAMIESAKRNTQSTPALREELSRLNELISIMNNNLNEATHKNACSLLRIESSLKEEIMMSMGKPQPKEDFSLLIKNLSEQISQLHTDIAQIKRSTSIRPPETIIKESMVKEEEPNLNQTLKILPPITD